MGGRNFQLGNGGQYRSLAKFATADGTQDTQWDPNPGQILALTMTDSGLYAGGKFTVIGGKTKALGRIVDGHLLTVTLTATNTDAYEGRIVSDPEGLVCEPHTTTATDCKQALVPGNVTLKTVSGNPAVALSQQWVNGCETSGGTLSDCGVDLNADKTVEVELSCENHDLPAPDQPIATFRNVWCNNIQAVNGFEIGDGGRVTFTANHGVTLGPGFRVNFQTDVSNQFFNVRMQPLPAMESEAKAGRPQ